MYKYLLLALLLLAVSVNAADRVYEESVNRVAFGSCNMDERGRQPWQSIAQSKPDIWLATGDNVYFKRLPLSDDRNAELETLPQALNRSLAALQSPGDPKGFDAFRETLRPGSVFVYDDHDFGRNDMGKENPYKDEAQSLLLDLALEPQDSPLRKRQGVYSSNVYGPPGRQLEVIALDTRYHRDLHYIPSVAGMHMFGEYRLPAAALIACVTRLFSAAFWLSADYEGDMLGEEQWQWLDETLENSTADVTVLVSSVQVLTTAGLVESWGHFPNSKARLLDLLRKHQPKGLVVVSGDVHFAEFLKGTGPTEAYEPGKLLEVTASSLTHSCAGNPGLGGKVMSVLCGALVETFKDHRLWPRAVYANHNYGVLDVDWESNQVSVSIRNMNGTSVLEVTQAAGVPVDIPSKEQVLHLHRHQLLLDTMHLCVLGALRILLPVVCVLWMLGVCIGKLLLSFRAR